jgi:esterase/lipase
VTVWDLQRVISKRLLIWSAASVLLGLVLIAVQVPFWTGFAIQAIAWGGIDAAIAVGGLWATRRRHARLPDPIAPEPLAREEDKLRRLLWINTGLDVLYVAAGLVAVLTLGRTDTRWRGHGWGIVIQGAFLFVFDLLQAQRVPASKVWPFRSAFQGEEHEPFLWSGGMPAALLLHGFGGTPAEMRPLGRALHEAGWTVKAPLLPGFGREIDTLGDRRFEDWLSAARQALDNLCQDHDPVLLVGYSMGASLATLAASEGTVRGLVLISPFWQLGSRLQRLIGRGLWPFLPPLIRPFRSLDLEDPKARDAIRQWIPEIDLDDATSRERVRLLSIPVSLVAEVIKIGQQAYQRANLIRDMPILVIQGAGDELVRLADTRQLVNRLRQQPYYLEVPGDHQITLPARPGWAAVWRAVTAFAASLWPAGNGQGPSV